MKLESLWKRLKDRPERIKREREREREKERDTPNVQRLEEKIKLENEQR